jgi:transglutaminase-like putative cysteine protease
MKFAITCSLEYYVSSEDTFVLNIRAHEGPGQVVTNEHIYLPDGLEHRLMDCGATGTRFDRFYAAHAGNYKIDYHATVETKPTRYAALELVDGGPQSFITEVLAYLYPSRYCQCDRLGNVAHDLFGHLFLPEEKVRAVVDWIATRLTYVGGSTNSSTSAVDSMLERTGVCRDYAHLGIALCRALNIPARYFTGYAHQLQPQDFHACFETWIGGRWLFWDATGLASPDGVVRIGTGRDAADCSICTSFGQLQLLNQQVNCEALDPRYRKMSPADLQGYSTCLE